MLRDNFAAYCMVVLAIDTSYGMKGSVDSVAINTKMVYVYHKRAHASSYTIMHPDNIIACNI